MSRWWLALVVSACSGSALPGNQQLGNYQVHAEPQKRECALTETLAAPFNFELGLSREVGTGHAWVTLAGYSRDATFDGQHVESTLDAPRVFAECAPCDTVVRERMAFDVFSTSQSEAVGDVCPDDGAAPAPDDDAGITSPMPISLGYDAVRICGFIKTSVRATPSSIDGGLCKPECGVDFNAPEFSWGNQMYVGARTPCEVRYRLTGDRR